MQNYYKISEISKLYGIGIDSLRYYEKIGVLKPKRGKNNYRLYSLNDIYKLNVIRELRPLNFSMQQIKEYLDNQSLDNTVQMLGEERDRIKLQIQELSGIDSSLKERIEGIKDTLSYSTGEYHIKELKSRPCVLLNANIQRDEEADFVIQKLHQKHENKIYNLGKQPIGATISQEDLTEGKRGVFRSVFYILDTTGEHDYLIPQGSYLSFSYRGDYEKSPDYVADFLEYAVGNEYKITGDIYEIYHVDNRYTINPEEFLTEIQVKIKTS